MLYKSEEKKFLWNCLIKMLIVLCAAGYIFYLILILN